MGADPVLGQGREDQLQHDQRPCRDGGQEACVPGCIQEAALPDAADGYYEWKTLEDGSKQPYRITLEPEQPFSFAGLWEHWEKDDKVMESCTIIVTDANELTKDIMTVCR